MYTYVRSAATRGWPDAQFKATVLEAAAHHANREPDTAVHLLGEALALVEQGSLVSLSMKAH